MREATLAFGNAGCAASNVKKAHWLISAEHGRTTVHWASTSLPGHTIMARLTLQHVLYSTLLSVNWGKSLASLSVYHKPTTRRAGITWDVHFRPVAASPVLSLNNSWASFITDRVRRWQTVLRPYNHSAVGSKQGWRLTRLELRKGVHARVIPAPGSAARKRKQTRAN